MPKGVVRAVGDLAWMSVTDDCIQIKMMIRDHHYNGIGGSTFVSNGITIFGATNAITSSRRSSSLTSPRIHIHGATNGICTSSSSCSYHSTGTSSFTSNINSFSPSSCFNGISGSCCTSDGNTTYDATNGIATSNSSSSLTSNNSSTLNSLIVFISLIFQLLGKSHYFMSITSLLPSTSQLLKD